MARLEIVARRLQAPYMNVRELYSAVMIPRLMA